MTEQEVFKFCTIVSKLPAPDVFSKVPAPDVLLQPTPQLFADLLLDFHNKSLVPDCFVVDSRIWSTIMADKSFQDLIEPVSTYDSVLSGHVAKLYGVPVVTDAYFSPYLDAPALDKDRIYLHRLFNTRVAAIVSGDKALRAI